jgi:hypothetical protein
VRPLCVPPPAAVTARFYTPACMRMRCPRPCQVLYSICWMAQAPVLPYLVDKLGAKGSGEYGRLQTLFSAVQFLGGLISGAAASQPRARVPSRSHTPALPSTPACAPVDGSPIHRLSPAALQPDKWPAGRTALPSQWQAGPCRSHEGASHHRAGPLMDRYGARWLFAVSFAASFAVYGLTAAASSTALLYVSRVPTVLQVIAPHVRTGTTDCTQGHAMTCACGRDEDSSSQ